MMKSEEQIIRDPIQVSILVPVYNVERYLDECLTSISSQTLDAIEIIIINDGSTDNSPAIIRRHAAKDSRIRIIDKPNSGYGQSMNMALDVARGDYIGIVESDDFIDREMFETLYRLAEAHNAQIVRCDYYLTWTQSKRVDEHFHSIRPEYANRLIDPYKDYAILRAAPAIWSSLYRREFLRDSGIRFAETPGASYQDTSFFLKVFSTAKRVFAINEAFYHYRQDNSYASIKSREKVFMVVDEFKSYLAYLDTLPSGKEHFYKLAQSIMYLTYRWNLRRIQEELRGEFLDYMYSYFCEAMNQGILDRSYFEGDYYDELLILLDNPRGYLELLTGRGSLGLMVRKLRIYLRANGVKRFIEQFVLRRSAHG